MSPRKLPRHLVWLESFVTAVEAGSLEAAADHLGLARSVVSEHLKALELALAGGAPLLERGPGRRLRLTARGERLYEGAQSPLAQLGLRRLKDLAAEEPPIRIGLNPTASQVLLGAIAEDAAKQGLRLEVAFLGSYEIVRQAQQRQLDLAVGFTPLPPHRGVASLSLRELPFAVLAGPGCVLESKLGRRRSVPLRELEGLPFVDWLRDDPYGGANSARFAEHDITVKEVARVESFLQLYVFLRVHRACAIGPDLRGLGQVPEDIRSWRLEETQPQSVELVALWPARGLTPGAEALLEGLKGRMAKGR